MTAGWLLSLVVAAEPSLLEVLPPDRLAAVRQVHAAVPALVFTETRDHPIRHVDGIPAAWEPQIGQPPAFHGSAQPGEFYVFQLGVYALRDLGPLAVTFDTLGAIPAKAQRCLSLGGIGTDGRPFAKQISVPDGHLQALWCGIDVPTNAKGSYQGRVVVRLSPRDVVAVPLTLDVTGDPVPDHGDDTARNLSRLRWLDSDVGSEPTLTQPFTAVQVSGRRIGVLGRELWLGDDGLPARIVSHFEPSNTAIGKDSTEVLAQPMAFVVETATGPVVWRRTPGRVTRTDLEARWTAALAGDGLHAAVTGRLDYTGSGEIRVTLTADRAVELKDTRLEAAWREPAATWFMGLNQPGGQRPERVAWQWDVTKRQDCFWLGAVNAGLMLRFKDADYVRPPVNIYYHFRELKLPRSWGGAVHGGIAIAPAAAGRVPLRAFSGPRTMQAGETLDYVFELYLTPFRPLDTAKQWSTRFSHPNPSHDAAPMDRALAECDPVHGPNVLNVHQANYYSPYINYPYSDDSFPALVDLTRRAHAKGVRVRVYYTTREITQNMPELFALHSLNGEVILPGPGKDARTLIHPNGPHAWLTENLRGDFIPAWVDHIGGKYAEWDLSVITNPDSRWNNFYLEGLRWLTERGDLDGVYIDDTALDSRSLQRARRILDHKAGRLMDLHTWNHMNQHAGWANNLTIYAEILPYLDRLWLGEGFNASTVSPDFWLVEMSGLPFGLMSEMLDGANAWRGLVFGETARLHWSGDPRPIWKAWDDWGLAGSRFIPWYDPAVPVKSGRPDVLATVWHKPGRSLVALASWAADDVDVTPTIDWKTLGLDPAKATLYAPPIAGFQTERLWRPGEPMEVAPGRGWFLVVDEQPRHVARTPDAAAALVELWREPFSAPALDPAWSTHASARAGTKLETAGALRLTASAHSVAGLERALPPGVTAVEFTVEPGTDAGQSWGPGIALVWANGQAAKLNARLEDMRYGLWAGGGFQIAGGPITRTGLLHLRLLLSEQAVVFQEQRANGNWRELGTLPRSPALAGNPVLLRVGKHSPEGTWRDHSEPGAAGTCAVREVRVLGQ